MNKTIRVAQIMGKWLGGGVESFVMNYYRHINHEKIQFDFICDSDSTNIPYSDIEKLGGKVILVPPYQKILSYHKEIKKIFKENKYKIVHSHINTLSIFPLFAAKLAGVPVRIAHSHSTYNWQETKRTLLKFFLRPFSKIFATHYFACSELSAKFLFGKKTTNLGKVTIINNAIEIEKFKFNKKIRNKIRKEMNISNDYTIIGHVGRFMITKNHNFIIEIFNEIKKQNPKTVLVLIGQGELMLNIKQKVKALGLTKDVIFLGQQENIYDYYQAMDIFILPSLYEGLGMALIEAQASGLTCIASNKVPLCAKLTNNVYFINTKYKDKWIKLILNEKINCRNNSIENIELNYNISKQTNLLEKIYYSLWRNI